MRRIEKELNFGIHILEDRQICALRAIQLSGSETEKQLAEAVLNVNEGIQDLMNVFKTISQQGGFVVKGK
jgi:hypothetical protein